MIINWEDNEGNLYEAKLYGHQDYPHAILKVWSRKNRKSSKAGVHSVLYEREGNINLSDLSVSLAKKAREYGCPYEKADEIMKHGFYRYKDGQIP